MQPSIPCLPVDVGNVLAQAASVPPPQLAQALEEVMQHLEMAPDRRAEHRLHLAVLQAALRPRQCEEHHRKHLREQHGHMLIEHPLRGKTAAVLASLGEGSYDDARRAVEADIANGEEMVPALELALHLEEAARGGCDAAAEPLVDAWAELQASGAPPLACVTGMVLVHGPQGLGEAGSDPAALLRGSSEAMVGRVPGQRMAVEGLYLLQCPDIADPARFPLLYHPGVKPSWGDVGSALLAVSTQGNVAEACGCGPHAAFVRDLEQVYSSEMAFLDMWRSWAGLWYACTRFPLPREEETASLLARLKGELCVEEVTVHTVRDEALALWGVVAHLKAGAGQQQQQQEGRRPRLLTPLDEVLDRALREAAPRPSHEALVIQARGRLPLSPRVSDLGLDGGFRLEALPGQAPAAPAAPAAVVEDVVMEEGTDHVVPRDKKLPELNLQMTETLSEPERRRLQEELEDRKARLALWKAHGVTLSRGEDNALFCHGLETRGGDLGLLGIPREGQKTITMVHRHAQEQGTYRRLAESGVPSVVPMGSLLPKTAGKGGAFHLFREEFDAHPNKPLQTLNQVLRGNRSYENAKALFGRLELNVKQDTLPEGVTCASELGCSFSYRATTHLGLLHKPRTQPYGSEFPRVLRLGPSAREKKASELLAAFLGDPLSDPRTKMGPFNDARPFNDAVGFLEGGVKLLLLNAEAPLPSSSSSERGEYFVEGVLCDAVVVDRLRMRTSELLHGMEEGPSWWPAEAERARVEECRWTLETMRLFGALTAHPSFGETLKALDKFDDDDDVDGIQEVLRRSRQANLQEQTESLWEICRIGGRHGAAGTNEDDLLSRICLSPWPYAQQSMRGRHNRLIDCHLLEKNWAAFVSDGTVYAPSEEWCHGQKCLDDRLDRLRLALTVTEGPPRLTCMFAPTSNFQRAFNALLTEFRRGAPPGGGEWCPLPKDLRQASVPEEEAALLETTMAYAKLIDFFQVPHYDQDGLFVTHQEPAVAVVFRRPSFVTPEEGPMARPEAGLFFFVPDMATREAERSYFVYYGKATDYMLYPPGDRKLKHKCYARREITLDMDTSPGSEAHHLFSTDRVDGTALLSWRDRTSKDGQAKGRLDNAWAHHFAAAKEPKWDGFFGNARKKKGGGGRSQSAYINFADAMEVPFTFADAWLLNTMWHMLVRDGELKNDEDTNARVAFLNQRFRGDICKAFVPDLERDGFLRADFERFQEEPQRLSVERKPQEPVVAPDEEYAALQRWIRKAFDRQWPALAALADEKAVIGKGGGSLLAAQNQVHCLHQLQGCVLNPDADGEHQRLKMALYLPLIRSTREHQQGFFDVLGGSFRRGLLLKLVPSPGVDEEPRCFPLDSRASTKEQAGAVGDQIVSAWNGNMDTSNLFCDAGSGRVKEQQIQRQLALCGGGEEEAERPPKRKRAEATGDGTRRKKAKYSLYYRKATTEPWRQVTNWGHKEWKRWNKDIYESSPGHPKRPDSKHYHPDGQVFKSFRDYCLERDLGHWCVSEHPLSITTQELLEEEED